MLGVKHGLGEFGSPESGGGGRDDGDTTLFFLLHPVHLSVTVVNITNLVGFAGVEKNTLRSGSFTSVDVSDNTNVSNLVHWERAILSFDGVLSHNASFQ